MNWDLEITMMSLRFRLMCSRLNLIFSEVRTGIHLPRPGYDDVNFEGIEWLDGL